MVLLFGWRRWRGESGRRYRFKITLTRRGVPEYGGVYIFVRRRFVFFLKPLYVGKATSFKERLFGHEKWASAVYDKGATERHVMHVMDREHREAIEEDLIRGLRPPMNDVMIPRSAKDRAIYKPVGFGWSVENWLRFRSRQAADRARREAAAAR